MRTFYILGIFAAFNCGDGKTNNPTGPQDGGDDKVDNSSPECTTSDQCQAPNVCQPVSKTCETPGAECTQHGECADGTYCETQEGYCLPSSAGTPCEGPDNCTGECIDGMCGCDGLSHAASLQGGPLDLYLVLDRTGSMGRDCAYDPLTEPTAPVASKACYATYALADYLIDVSPVVDTRLAFHVMSLSNDCTGTSYATPLIPLTSLPTSLDSALVQRISDEDFSGGYGTRIEGALRGIANYTSNNQTSGREMIGVLVTDGDATECERDTATLAQIVADHRAATGLRTFVIGMTGATEPVLEEIAIAGGADPHDDFCGELTPPCHYWNVGDGSGAVLANALRAISEQAVPLPCTLDVTGLSPPEGEVLDYARVNVTLSEGTSESTIAQVPNADACPTDQMAWYYDVPDAPKTIHLCQTTCDSVTAAGNGATLAVVAGCHATVVID